MNEVMTIQNVRAYLDEQGTVFLNAEDVARGLGFFKTEEKFSTTSGRKTYTTIRWERVNGYLKEFGYKTAVGKNDFIPENMVYRLAMKANNETAQIFQSKVADEILPAIRKHGAYMTPETIEKVLLNPDFIIKLATELKNERAKNAILQPKADYYDAVMTCEDAIPVTVIAKEYGMSGVTFNKLLNSEQIQFVRDNVWLLYRKYDGRGYTVTQTLHVGGRNKIYTCWTQKGREFLYYFLKARGIVPIRERQDTMANLFLEVKNVSRQTL